MEKMIDDIFDWLDGEGKPLFYCVIAFAAGYFTGVIVWVMQ